jgi:cobalamin biosynthesis protein CobT
MAKTKAAKEEEEEEEEDEVKDQEEEEEAVKDQEEKEKEERSGVASKENAFSKLAEAVAFDVFDTEFLLLLLSPAPEQSSVRFSKETPM